MTLIAHRIVLCVIYDYLSNYMFVILHSITGHLYLKQRIPKTRVTKIAERVCHNYRHN